MAGSPCLALCQYDLRCFEPALLLQVLATHPMVVNKTEAYSNFYHIPPAEFLGKERPAAILRHRLKSLADRREVERELRATRANFHSVINRSGDGIIIIDRKGIARFVNPVAESLFGGKKEELQGELFGYPNLCVADGSVVPDNLGVNPSLNITALSEYIMSQMPENKEA